MTLNPQSVEIDEAILKMAKTLFRKTPRLTKCHSEVNYCVILSFDDTTADRVVKLANRNRGAVEVERHLYPAMRAAGLPVPEIEFTNEDYPESAEPFIVMPKFSDNTLGELCKTKQKAAISSLEASGKFIQMLHGRFADQFATFAARDDLSDQLASAQLLPNEALNLDLIQKNDPDLFEIAEHHLADLSEPGTEQLTHGQPHTSNILADESGRICVIDFGETIGMSSPLRDLCILLISHDGWSRGTGDPEQRLALIEAYGRINDAGLQELHYWELSFWLRALLDYLRFAEDPTKDARFVANQLRRIQGIVKEIAAGRGLTHSLWV